MIEQSDMYTDNIESKTQILLVIPMLLTRAEPTFRIAQKHAFELFSQVLNRTMEPPHRNTPPQEHLAFPSLLPGMNPPLMPFPLPTPGPMAAGAAAGMMGQQPPSRDCIRLRGLPFEASVTDILSFLGDHARNIVYQGVHMVYNAAVSSQTSILSILRDSGIVQWWSTGIATTRTLVPISVMAAPVVSMGSSHKSYLLLLQLASHLGGPL